MAGESDAKLKAEIDALQTVLSALAPLEEQVRVRVIRYAQERFGVSPGGRPASTVSPPPTAPTAQTSQIHTPVPLVTDVRTLKEQKQPSTAVEMAAILAYYLAELAPEGERKQSITVADINKYFKQADYPLPSSPRVTLHQAKNSGYLDSASRGQYKLNPVGHNLVAHGLPRAKGASAPATASRRKTRKKPRGSAKGSKRPTRSSAARKPTARSRKRA